jgi:hypothetical protein
MAPTTDRQTFRETVAAVAGVAKAKLPQAVNGRIESAVKLVLWQDVEPQDDGSILVGSASDPGKQYRLVGLTCECQDFTRGQAPEGWCQHRIAAGIQKRVQQLLAQPPASVVPAEGQAPAEVHRQADTPAEVYGNSHTPAPLPEAPASANVRVTIAGREVQITLRDVDEARLLVRLEELLQRYPLPQPDALRGPKPEGQGKDWCRIHNCAMKENVKDGRRWYSHQVDGRWCKGR